MAVMGLAMKFKLGPGDETDGLYCIARCCLGMDQVVAACSCDIIQAAFNKRGTHLVRNLLIVSKKAGLSIYEILVVTTD